MTEFEIGSLANELQNTSNNMLMGYFSLVSGFFVVSYVVAHKLTKTMTAGIVALFMLWSFGLISVNFSVTRNFYGLLAKIHEAAEAGNGFEWHSARLAPGWMLEYRAYGSTLFLVLVAVGAVYFFFHCRRVNRKAELEAAKI